MATELKPLGNQCNLGCDYCYQEPMRNAGNTRASKGYDLDLMMKIADEQGARYTIFGGEPLLLPKKDLERLLRHSFKKFGGSTLQTNGSLIDDDHIRMFKKYNCRPGISFDGPNELNGMRKSIMPNKSSEELTTRTMEAFRKLSQARIHCGIIITVHKMNGTKDTLPRLLNFIRWLGDLGHNGGNIHMLEVDSHKAAQYCLTHEENEWAFLEMAKFFDLPENQDLRYEPFREVEEMQRFDDSNAHCIWKSCDPMNTGAVYGIEGNGQLTNCGMVNKEGIEWTKSNDRFVMRDIVLYQTPPELGGCKGCEYFLMCNGYCPGSAQEGDWRNKTVYCSSLKKMFKYYEDKIINDGGVPTSKRPDRVELEEIYFENILMGRRLNFQDLLEISRNYERTIPVK